MDFIKVDRDLILNKLYECRGKINHENREVLTIINDIEDLLIQSETLNTNSKYPKIRFSGR